MNIHVVCPFYRRHLYRTLVGYYSTMRIIFHPVCDAVDIEPFEKNSPIAWIKPLLCPPLHIPPDQAYRKFNDFIDAGDIVDGDYYAFTGDDDMFEPGFFDVVRQQTHKILFSSNYRGDTIPNDNAPAQGRHPTFPLIMRTPADVRVCNIGTTMFTVKGEILRQTRFSNETCVGDGLYAEELIRRWPNDFKFLPDSFSFGGYFQPGRFTTKAPFLKSTWELPVTIN